MRILVNNAFMFGYTESYVYAVYRFYVLERRIYSYVQRNLSRGMPPKPASMSVPLSRTGKPGILFLYLSTLLSKHFYLFPNFRRRKVYRNDLSSTPKRLFNYRRIILLRNFVFYFPITFLNGLTFINENLNILTK